MRRTLLISLLSCLSFFAAGQSYHYVNGTLDITINAFNPCGANPAINNGYLTFTVNAADGGQATLIFLDGPGGNDTFNQFINQGSTFTFNSSQTLPDGTYQFIIRDNLGNFTINTFADPTSYPPIVLTDISSPSLSEDVRTDNTSCFTPTGQIQSSISGGSETLAGGGSYSYTWTSDNGLAGLPLTGTSNGVAALNLAALLGTSGLPGGTYTLFVKDNYSTCTDTRSFTLTDPSPVVQNITTATPLNICAGDDITITLAASEAAPVTYEIVRNGVPSGISFPGSGAGPFVMTFSSATFADNDIILVRATNGFCSPVIMNGTVNLKISPLPTISGITITPVCTGTTTTNLSYTSTTGSPNQYSIDFNATAEAAGFTDIANTALPASPIVLNIPGAAPAGTYNATLTVRNSTTTCGSAAIPITITINPNPTITLGPNPVVCIGSTQANLTYSATTGTPDQYSINFNAAAEAAGFTDVTNAALTASPIVITIPGTATAGTYNATITVRNSATGCSSSALPISVTINALPTITLGANPSVCAGVTTANLAYSATTGSPDQYSIDFNAAANAAGFADVANATLPASPIVIAVPGAAAAGTYNGTLTVRNSTTGCTSTVSNISVTIIAAPTITLGTNPSVCSGVTSANLAYTGTTGSPDQYSIDFNAAAEGQGFVDVALTALPASPIAITIPGGAAPGTYNATITVRNSGTTCSSTVPFTVTINANPTITLGANPSVCIGSTTANLTYSATTGSPNQYSIDFNATAEAAGFVDVTNAVLPASPIVIVVPGAAPIGTYNAMLTVRNTTTNCGSSSSPISVTINSLPTITLGTNPQVCAGTTTANLSYSATTGTPDQYSINFNAAAEAQGFVDVVNATLPASPIVIAVPAAGAVGLYSAVLTVRNSVTGCTSATSNITVRINPNPTITPGPNPSVCAGSTTANLTYTATGTPNRYSVNYDAAAEAAGFVDVVNAVLPASPIVLVVPAAAPVGTYNATVSVSRTATGCVSATNNITITITPIPSITPGPNPSVCAGVTTANLTYTATTGTPDQYSIDFNAAAEAQGFTDVVNAALPASPIVIAVPGAAAAGTYNANLTVRNSGSGCASSSSPISVTILPTPAITLGANPSVCAGTTTANLPYTGTTGSPTQYSIDFNAAAEAAGFIDITNAALPASPIVIAVPGAAPAGTYNATISVRNGATTCSSAAQPITVTIVPNPTITLGANPSVCIGSTQANLPYTGTTGSPDQYSIDFNAAAEAAGFTDITNVAITASPIVITIPGTATVGTYNATLTVRNSTAGCTSSGSPITITIDSTPTITVGSNPAVCAGATTANLTYTGTTGTPDQYSINFDAAAEAAGFTDVTNAVLTASPIVIAVPGAAAAGTYNATISVRNSAAGCTSASSPITIIINPNPTITLGANPSVCLGAATANLPYTGTTGAPDRYTLDFNAAAEAAGFTDVVSAALPASPIVIAIPGAAAAGTYNATVTVINTVTGCPGAAMPVSVTILANPGITLGANPTVCSGATAANLSYSATAGSPDQYSIDFDAASEAAGFVDVINATLPASPIVINVPGAAAIGTYNATLTVRNSVAGCASAASPISVTIITSPTITLGANPSVCAGGTAANLTYSATTGAPDQYSIDFDAAAEAAGFADVVNAALPASPIVIVVPGSAALGTYNAILTVRNSVAGCGSASTPVSVTIISSPAITLGANPSVCSGSTTAGLSYSGTTGSPDEYSIDFDATAEAAGFVDIVNAALPASPISITIPGAATVGTYNATLTVRNSGAGCSSGASPISITINPAPSITLGANPSVCAGVTVAALGYTATTDAPDQYSIDFDATAEAQGFVDVVNASLPATPIQIVVPMAIVPGTYNASLTVRNSVTGCTGLGNAITVTIIAGPTISLGPDPAICLGTTTADITYSATTGAPDQYSINFNAAAEAQGFTDIVNAALPASPIQVAVPGGAVAGTYTGILTVRNSMPGGCSSPDSTITITINSNPTVDAGPARTICAGGPPANLAGTFTGSTGVVWTTAGDGSFGNTANAVTTYTPGPNDIIATTVTLTLSTLGPCPSVNDNVVITINAPAIVNAGTPQTICAGNQVTLNATFGGSATGIQWSSGGDGTFSDSTDVNATYTPGTNDRASGSVVLTATATGTCTGITDDVTITINPVATVDTGPPQAVCAGSAVLLSGSFGGSATSVTWTTAGDGTFNDPSSAGATYTPGTNDITAGSVLLTLTTNNPAGPCPAATDNVLITINAVPGDQTTFGNESWIGYVYDDNSNPAPPVSNIDFDSPKYKGFVNEADIIALGSTYDAASDQFNVNLSDNVPMAGPNVCGQYLENYSVRLKMRKTFAAGIYTFTLGADDGVRFFIDGAAIDLNDPAAFDIHSYTVFTTDAVCIAAGQHDLVIEYFENTSFSRLSFAYQLAPAPTVTSPVTRCVNSPAPTLTATSTDPGVTGFNWYADATLGAVLFSGASFTPGPADLDMTTVASTDFFVTAVFACGETQPAQVVVDVINTANITLPAPPTQVCRSGGTIDLTTLVTATPAGGTFTFSGTGVTVSPTFDPTLVAVSTTITVDYTSGTCTDSKTFDIDVTNTATITVPAANQSVCQSSGIQDLTALVSATPAGGIFTFTGAGVTGTNFDPSAQNGIVPIQVDYAVGGCTDTETFNFSVNASATLNTTNSSPVCPNAADVNLLSLVSASPAGGTFVFSGPGVTGNTFDPTAHAGTMVTINVTYDQGGCTASGTIQITVRSAADPVCNGGTNCGALTIFPITSGPTKIELPSCGNQDDGQLVFDVNLFAGGDSNFEFTLTRNGDAGFSQQQSGSGPFVFSGLYPDTYHYTVVDLINGHTCGPKDYTLLLQSVVTATVDPSSQVDATCFGEPTGQVIINATGSTTGEYYYSIDGAIWKRFVPGNPGEITDLPPNGTYSLLVGEVANDVCYDTAKVTINSANPAITATFDTDPATCNGNDGRIFNIQGSGGAGGPYEYSIDGTNFQTEDAFEDISGGTYTLTVRDATGCEQDFTATVTFPGIVNFTVTTTDAACQPDGIPTGSLEVFFAAAGTYQAGISVDPLVEPSVYVDYSTVDPLNDPLRFEDLINGTYYVFAKTSAASCPTRQGPYSINGAMALNFDIVPICVDNEVSIKLDNVTGDASSANPVEIYVYTILGNPFQPEIVKQFASEIPLNYDEVLFLRTPGEYRIQLQRLSDEAVCIVKSEMKTYVVQPPLSAQIGSVNESYPDILTGEMNVVNFNGGTIPYEIRIELDSAAVGGQSYQTDWEEVLQNANLQYQKEYTNIPAGRYKVEVMDEVGCVIELTGRVPLDIDIYIPNIFTPNEDGMNDVFFIRNLPATDAQLIITNRWGNQVYSSNSYQNNWAADKVSDGIYFYRLKVSDGKPITGWVEVLRGSKP